MKVVKCTKCGKLIHAAPNCPFCGCTGDFDSVPQGLEIHENAATEYSRLQEAINNEEYDKALDISNSVLEWMPFCSSVFWMRVLAKHNCRNDAALIRKGFQYESDEDFYNAVLFGSAEEKQVYQELQDCIKNIKDALVAAVMKNEFDEMSFTPLQKSNDEMKDEISRRRSKLFALWSHLEQIETNMQSVEEKCNLLIHEFEQTMIGAKEAAQRVANQINSRSEVDVQEAYQFAVLLNQIQTLTDDSMAEITARKGQHPFVNEFHALVSQRDKIASEIKSELERLRSYESRLQTTFSENERIEKKHKDTLEEVNCYSFSSACSLLGSKRFTEILESVLQ